MTTATVTHAFAHPHLDTAETCTCGASFFYGFNLQAMKVAHLEAHGAVVPPKEVLLGIADEGDLLVTVSAEVLRSLVAIAHEQMDELDEEEEAQAYGVSLPVAERLAGEARRIMHALDR